MNRPRRPGCRIEGLMDIAAATSSFRMIMIQQDHSRQSTSLLLYTDTDLCPFGVFKIFAIKHAGPVFWATLYIFISITFLIWTQAASCHGTSITAVLRLKLTPPRVTTSSRWSLDSSLEARQRWLYIRQFAYVTVRPTSQEYLCCTLCYVNI